MYTSLIRPCMTVRKNRIKLSREVVHNLKEISKLSSIKQWEYAGGIKYKNYAFSEPTRITSKKRDRVDVEEIEKVWYSEIAYHTHPGIGYNEWSVCENIQIFTTLPSNADFEAYIKGFPKMQVNLICESHGYYVIDILESSYNMAAPLPESVYEYMRKLRSQPFMRIGAFSDDGIEYFATTLKNWKTYINEQVNEDMMKLFGISIRYYGYSDEPPIVTVYHDIDEV